MVKWKKWEKWEKMEKDKRKIEVKRFDRFKTIFRGPCRNHYNNTIQLKMQNARNTHIPRLHSIPVTSEYSLFFLSCCFRFYHFFFISFFDLLFFFLLLLTFLFLFFFLFSFFFQKNCERMYIPYRIVRTYVRGDRCHPRTVER